MVRNSPTSRSRFVFARLRDDILYGELMPGSRLRFVELAERFSVSQTVIREALARLAEQGLATAVPQQGFRVVALSLDNLKELTDARIEMETLTLRRSIERGDVAWEATVVAAHHQLANTPALGADGQLSREFFDVHEAFHRSTVRACGNERLLTVTLALRDAATLYRWWSLPFGNDYQRDRAGELHAGSGRFDAGLIHGFAWECAGSALALPTA